MTIDVLPHTRSGGGAARRAVRSVPNIEILSGLHSNMPTCEIMCGSQVKSIDAASKDILESVGVVFRNDIEIAD